MDEKVLRKTLEEIILKNGVATHLTHLMATRLGKTFTGVRKNGGLWWLPPDGRRRRYLTHPMATWLGRKFTGVRKNGDLWWLPPDGEM